MQWKKNQRNGEARVSESLALALALLERQDHDLNFAHLSAEDLWGLVCRTWLPAARHECPQEWLHAYPMQKGRYRLLPAAKLISIKGCLPSCKDTKHLSIRSLTHIIIKQEPCECVFLSSQYRMPLWDDSKESQILILYTNKLLKPCLWPYARKTDQGFYSFPVGYLSEGAQPLVPTLGLLQEHSHAASDKLSPAYHYYFLNVPFADLKARKSSLYY